VNPTVILWKHRENRSSTRSMGAKKTVVWLSVRIRVDPWQKVLQKQMRRRPATFAASFVDPLILPSRRLGAASRWCWSESAHSYEECHIYQYCCSIAILRITSLQPLRWPAANPLRRASRKGGRNARATGSHSRAFPISPGNSPSRIAGCHQRHRKHRSASF